MAVLSASSIWELTKRDFTERFAGSALGSVWAMIWPLVMLTIYIIIFGRLMGTRLPGSSDTYAYGVYLASGLIPWTAFSATVARTTSAFLDKRHIISKVSVSLPSLLLVVCLSEAVTFCISMVIFLGFLLFTGHGLGGHLVLVPFLFLILHILAFALGLIAATFTVFLRDLREVVGIVLQLWFWFTPIVYVPDILPETLKGLLMYNPAFVVINAYHQIFVFHSLHSVKPLIILTCVTHGLLLVSYLVFMALEKDVRDFL